MGIVKEELPDEVIEKGFAELYDDIYKKMMLFLTKIGKGEKEIPPAYLEELRVKIKEFVDGDISEPVFQEFLANWLASLGVAKPNKVAFEITGKVVEIKTKAFTVLLKKLTPRYEEGVSLFAEKYAQLVLKALESNPELKKKFVEIIKKK